MTDFPMGDAFRASRALADEGELSGLSAQDINRLSMAQYREIRRRAGLPDVDPFEQAYKDYDEPVAGIPRQGPPTAPQPVQEQPQGLDPNSPEYFAAWRQERLARSTSGEGHGIFSSVPSQSQAYTNAVRAQAGRTSLSNQNVQEAPRIGRVFIQDSPVQGRTMGYRGA